MLFMVILIKASELDSRDDCLALFRLMRYSVSLLMNKKRVTHPHGQATRSETKPMQSLLHILKYKFL